MATISDFKVGDRVYFGRTRGEKTLGTVVKVNPKRLKVRQEEARGSMRSYPVGTVWTVPPVLCSQVSGDVTPTPAPMPTPRKVSGLTVGTTVEFKGFSWAARGEATLVGVVTKTGSTLEAYGEGRFHNLHDPTTVKAVGRRSDADIVKACSAVYGSLSPENLTCDGELSRTAVRAKAARLNRALKALWKEAGREITESETWKAWEATRAHAG